VRNGNGWNQTLTLLLAIILACVSGSVWIQGQHHDLHTAIVSVKHDQAGSWSRSQQQQFVDDLRGVSDHPVPTLTLRVKVRE
jgi:apolipoprotein N-acyltransferase